MRYELWGLHPANLIETFETETDALAEVRGLLEAGWSAEDLSLGSVDDRSVVAEGAALARLAASDDTVKRARSA
jgi:hypothetical protein